MSGWIGPPNNRQYWEVDTLTWSREPIMTQAWAAHHPDEGHSTNIGISVEGDDKPGALRALRKTLLVYGQTEIAGLVSHELEEVEA